MEKENKEKDNNLTVYEVSYLLLPSLALGQVSSSVDSLKKIISGLDGAMISDEDPILIDLAYPMTKVIGTNRHKVDSGYFGWMKFEITSSGIEAVKKALDGSDDVLRYLVIKTVRENTLLQGKMMLKKEEKLKRDDFTVDDVEVEAVKEVPAEELDKSIDDLVIA